MARRDLLALTDDDLVALTNRGIVKRARKEHERGAPAGELAEDDDGSVRVRWSDGVECLLPGDGTLADGTCTSGAQGITRAMVRAVLLYQQLATTATNVGTLVGAHGGAPATHGGAPATHGGEPATHGGEPAANEPWDPGAIDDEELAGIFPKATLTRTRNAFEREAAVELVRGPKPTARYFLRPCFVRFTVPGDPRYARCSCGKEPCPSIAEAVWAFRRLDPEHEAGLVSCSKDRDALPEDLLAEVESAVDDLCELGASGTSGPFGDALGRLEARCRQAALVWPAEILADLLAEWRRYAAADARFAPARVRQLLAELLIRLDALRGLHTGTGDDADPAQSRLPPSGGIPEVFIRGSASDRETRLAKRRFLGLGSGAELLAGGVELTAYLQDMTSGDVVALSRRFADPEDGSGVPKPFHVLGQAPLHRGLSFHRLGAGQLLAHSVKLSAGRRLTLGRGAAAAHPQRFDWQSLREPLAAAGFAEIRHRLATRPPRSLRPRRVADDLSVCRLAAIEHADFDVVEQAVVARLVDAEGERAILVHPYTHRGREGTERLLRLLTESPDAARWVAGRCRLGHGELTVEPISLVFESEDGRFLLQPWIDREDDDAKTPGVELAEAVELDRDPLSDWLERLAAELADLLLQGMTRAGPAAGDTWRQLAERGDALGSRLLQSPVEQLAAELRSRRHQTWDPRPAIDAAKQLAVQLEIASEILAPGSRPAA